MLIKPSKAELCRIYTYRYWLGQRISYGPAAAHIAIPFDDNNNNVNTNPIVDSWQQSY